jgi:predicted MFS family arabinose efflux permease
MPFIKLLVPVVSIGAATVILSTIAYVSLINGKGSSSPLVKGVQETTAKISTAHGGVPISAVPEANTGLVMIPFVGAVLVFSSLQLSRLKAQKSGSHS